MQRYAPVLEEEWQIRYHRSLCAVSLCGWRVGVRQVAALRFEECRDGGVILRKLSGFYRARPVDRPYHTSQDDRGDVKGGIQCRVASSQVVRGLWRKGFLRMAGVSTLSCRLGDASLGSANRTERSERWGRHVLRTSQRYARCAEHPRASI